MVPRELGEQAADFPARQKGLQTSSRENPTDEPT